MNSALLQLDSVRRLSEESKLVLGPAWDQERAVSLHGEIERLAELAEAGAKPLLAGAALELFVFACSLIELGRPPSDLVHAEIVRLCDGLVAAASGHSGRAAIAPERRARKRPELSSRSPRLILLSSPDEALLEICGELGRLQFPSERAASTAALAAALTRCPATLVLISPAWLVRASEVSGAVDEACQGRLDRPGLVAIIPAEDAEARMYVLRAGFDAVVEQGSAAEMARAVLECARERRKAAFRVLVVEDDRAQAMFVQSVLGYRGIEVQWAENAERALQHCASDVPDLVLLDLHLPDRNGIEVAQMLRERPGFEWVQIVFLSGESDREEQVRAIRLGADDWIAKPVRPRHLLSVVEGRAMRARSLRPLLSHPSQVELPVNRRARWLEDAEHALVRHVDSANVLLALKPDGESVQRMGFVDQGQLVIEMAQAASLLPGCRSRVCVVEDVMVMLLLDAEQAHDSQLEHVQASWNRRRWLSNEQPTSLSWIVAALTLPRGGRSIHEAVKRVLVLLEHAASKEVRIAVERVHVHSAIELPPAWTALLASPAVPKHGAAMSFRFRPLQPVRGRLSDQYLLRPRWRLETGFEVGHDQVLQRAEAAGRIEAIERAVLGQALQLQAQRHEVGRIILPWVELSMKTAGGDRLPAWLRAESKRRGGRMSELTLLFSRDDVMQSPAQAERSWGILAELGVRIALGGLARDDVSLELMRSGNLHAYVVRADEAKTPAEDGWAAWLKLSREYGKTLVVSEVNARIHLSEWFASSVHYIAGDAVAEELVETSFDFSTSPEG